MQSQMYTESLRQLNLKFSIVVTYKTFFTYEKSHFRQCPFAEATTRELQEGDEITKYRL